LNIVLFYALEVDSQIFEIQCSKSQLQFQVGGSTVNKLSLRGHSIFLVKLASGSSRSGVIAAALLQRVQVDFIVSIGPCGDVSGKKRVGDWHVIERVIGWQMGRNGIPDQVRKEEQGWGKILEFKDIEMKQFLPNITKSVLLSGDAFISSADFARQLYETLGGNLVDMNLSGIALAAHHFGIKRQLHLRVISDGADESAGDDFQNFVAKYDGKGGSFILDILGSLPPDVSDPMNYDNLRKLLEPRDGAGTTD